NLFQKFITEPSSNQNFKQISKSTNELFFENQISAKTYRRLIDLFSILYIENYIYQKVENKMNYWDKKFSDTIERYWEKIF
ncbi:MAG: hypothetical protein SCK70_08410, partial [bacterium]|nr:hypothetical protein [bacterium]